MHPYHNLYNDDHTAAVTCGFYGVYAHSPDDAALYVITDQVRHNLILVPLTTNWYWTAVKLLENVSYQKVYIAMPNVNVRMVADCINLALNYRPKKFLVNIIYPEPFFTTVTIGDPVAPSLMQMTQVASRAIIPGLDCSINYLSMGAATSGQVNYAIEVISNHGRHLLLEQVDLARGPELLKNIMEVDKKQAYKWVSIPWRQGTFGGFSMYDIVCGTEYLQEDVLNIFKQFRSQFSGRLVPYRFSCFEEFQDAKRGAPTVNVPGRLVL